MNSPVDVLSIRISKSGRSFVEGDDIRNLLRELLGSAVNTSDELRKVDAGKKKDHIRTLFQDVSISIENDSSDFLEATITAQPRMTPRQMSSAAPRSVLKHLASILKVTNTAVLGRQARLVYEVVEPGISSAFCRSLGVLVKSLKANGLDFYFDWAKNASEPINYSFSAIWLGFFDEIVESHNEHLSSKHGVGFKAEVTRRLSIASEPVLQCMESYSQTADKLEQDRHKLLLQKAQNIVAFVGLLVVMLLAFGVGALKEFKASPSFDVMCFLLGLALCCALLAAIFAFGIILFIQSYKNPDIDNILSMSAIAREELRESHEVPSLVFRRSWLGDFLCHLNEKRIVNNSVANLIYLSQALAVLFVIILICCSIYMLFTL